MSSETDTTSNPTRLDNASGDLQGTVRDILATLIERTNALREGPNSEAHQAAVKAIVNLINPNE